MSNQNETDLEEARRIALAIDGIWDDAGDVVTAAIRRTALASATPEDTAEAEAQAEAEAKSIGGW